MQDALTVAEGVLADENATPEQVDAAISLLSTAGHGLVKASDQPGDGDNDNAGKGDGDNAGDNGNANGGDAGKATAAAAASGNGGSTSGNAAAASSTGGKLSQTGDAAPVAPIVGGGLIAALGAIVSAAALRLRKRNEQ